MDRKMESGEKLKRNSTVEFLRILAMIFIVCSHYSVHGGIDNTKLFYVNPLNAVILQVAVLGNLGVDIFVIITGYYLVNKKWAVKRVLRILFQVWSYSVVIYFVLLALGEVELSRETLLRALCPTLTGQYWFFTAYFILYVLLQFINPALLRLDKAAFLRLLLILLVFWCLIPTITGFEFCGTEIPQFVMLYSIGAYMRLFPSKAISMKKSIIAIAVISVLMFGTTVFADIAIERWGILGGKQNYFYSRTSVLTLLLAYLFVRAFTTAKKTYFKYINAISGCVFGVYLFHDNRSLKKILWQKLLHTTDFADSPLLILHMIGAIILVFACGVVIEMIRQKIFNTLSERIVDKSSQLLDKYSNKLLSFFLNK